jgi:iron only hydrogenase large subunit-like protein
MNINSPVYTEKAQCQDCYKCIRECPVKAIRVENHAAWVMTELCIACGHCVNICPAGAKKYRDDLQRAKRLVASGKKVIASIAPSFVSELGDIPTESLIAAIKKLGFMGVSETALGAEEVSAGTARLLEASNGGVYISSACPTVVELISKYYSASTENITPLMSPVIAHCRLLRKIYGDDIGIVFISPCIAKKTEADKNREILDIAIVFDDLRRWLADEKIDIGKITPGEDDVFIPYPAKEGALYPLEGGMVEGIKAFNAPDDVHYITFSGMESIKTALSGMNESVGNEKVFIEALACEGGCINGPKVAKPGATIGKRLAVEIYAEKSENEPKPRLEDISAGFAEKPVQDFVFSEANINKALRSIGKYSPADEQNCGGCGYDSCRAFAMSLLTSRSEQSMCVSYMRKLAMNKANALIRAMPSGVVIVDENLKIIECNKKFAEIIGGDVLAVYQSMPGLEGAILKKIVPFWQFFSNTMETSEEIIQKPVKVQDKIITLSVFPIEKNRIVGGIIRDVTEPEVQKEQIIQKAKEVIHKNIYTVQQIAYLLGENAAESEVILNSIIESFQAVNIQEGNNPHG